MKHPHRKKRSKINFAWPWIVAFLGAVSAVVILAAGNAKFSETSASAEEPDVVVYKRSSCNCCNLWVEHLRDNGLKVSVASVDNTQSIQKRFGVPEDLAACHTA